MTPSAPLQVHVRIRPLISEEKGHDLADMDLEKDGRIRVRPPAAKLAVNPNFRAPPLRRRAQPKEYGVFDRVFDERCDNQDVYQAAVRPLLQDLTSSCVYTYGHTGSGKTHTLLGYGEEAGMYQLAAQDLLKDWSHVLVRVTELYRGNATDLLTGDACTIRQDKDIVYIRGPMVTDEEGRINQRPLGQVCSTAEQVQECVEEACEARRVGTSTRHSQSSRSHLIIELECVTPELEKLRHVLIQQEAQVTRLKWVQYEKSFGKQNAIPPWAEDYFKSSKLLRQGIKEYESLAKDTKAAIQSMMDSSELNLGSALVFCDLAGNEYARESAQSTKEEREEAAEINKSLLAVKNMIRALQSGAKVSGRDSKLSMILRHHSKAVMLAHASPSQESLKQTINTLNYAALVAAPIKGKENAL